MKPRITCVEAVKQMKVEADGYDETLFDAIIERLESLQSKPNEQAI